MTTLQIPQRQQSQALADGISKAVEVGDLEARRALADLRVTAHPNNANTASPLSWAEHAPVARALRRAAEHLRAAQPEGTADPVPGQLEDLAAQADANLATHRINGGHH